MSNLEIKVSKYQQQMNDWMKSIGLPSYQPDSYEVEDILKFDRNILRTRSSTQLSEDALILSQYALFLQQKMNECKSFIKWSSQNIGSLFGDDRSQLNKWIQHIELRIEKISYVTRRIEVVCQNINCLVRARYNEGG